MERQTRIARIVGEILWDSSPDVSYLEQDYNEPSIPSEEAAKYREQDRERLEALHNGDWYMVGVRAVAEVEVPDEQLSATDRRLGQTIRLVTPGIWGVESDSGEDYFREIVADELDYIRSDLRALRFTDEEIDAAMPSAQDIELVERSDEDVRAYYASTR